ncbi:MAG: M56 family metallopeptidase [Pseudomonadota bacterium]
MILLLTKLTLLLGATCLGALCLRGASPAARHAVVVAGLLAALLLPLMMAVLPVWEVLPAREVAPPVTFEAERLSAPLSTEARDLAPPSTGMAGAAPSHTAATSGQPLVHLPAAVWLTGTAALLALLAGRVLAMRRQVRRARSLCDARWQQRLTDACHAQDIQKPVRLLLRKQGAMPATWGVLRPAILLPADCMRWPDARCRDVLHHELAHVARGDVATRLLAHVVCALYWFHPLAWVLKRRMLIESELAADDRAMAQAAAPTHYANHLLQTAADCSGVAGLAPVMANPSQLETRIMAILATDRNRTITTRRSRLAISLLVIGACVVMASIGRAQPGTVIGSAEAVQFGQSDSRDFARHLESLDIETDDVDALLAGLGSSNALTRGASAWALGDSDDERVVAPLVQAAYDSEALVRQWAVRSLEPWTKSSVAQALVDRLQDADAEVRQWAARSLNRHDPAVKAEPLMATLNDDNAEVREWAARGLGDVGGEAVSTALARRLEVETSADASEWLIRSLDDSEGNVETLITATRNPSADVREWAARGLAGQRDDRAVDALIALLGDGSTAVREWSVRGLGVCGNERAVPALAAMEDDVSADVRDWARRSLEAIDC